MIFAKVQYPRRNQHELGFSLLAYFPRQTTTSTGGLSILFKLLNNSFCRISKSPQTTNAAFQIIEEIFQSPYTCLIRSVSACKLCTYSTQAKYYAYTYRRYIHHRLKRSLAGESSVTPLLNSPFTIIRD